MRLGGGGAEKRLEKERKKEGGSVLLLMLRKDDLWGEEGGGKETLSTRNFRPLFQDGEKEALARSNKGLLKTERNKNGEKCNTDAAFSNAT